MLRKIVSILGLAMFLILATGAGPASASKPQASSSWTPVFQTAQGPANSNGFVIFAVESFNDQLFMVVSSFEGALIYRSLDGSSWSNVTPPGLASISVMSWDMQAFDGKLYISVNDDGTGNHPAIILRTANGKDWETVFDGSLADLGGSVADKLGVFNGQIYLTSVGNGGGVWRSRTGNPGSWVLATPSLGVDVTNTSSPTAFNGDLYFSGYSAAGMQVWRSHNGATWETLGAGVLDVPNNTGASNLAVFNGALYLGAANSVDGGRIYRSKNGRDWQLLGNQDFTALNMVDISALAVYDGQLYAFGNDAASSAKILRSSSAKPGDWELTNGSGGWGANSWVLPNNQAIFKGHLYAANISGWWGNGIELYRLGSK